jgi:hypothetical protein
MMTPTMSTPMGGILVAGMKVSHMLSFEVSGDYNVNDPKDADSGFDEKTKAYDVYLQSVIALAPGFFVSKKLSSFFHLYPSLPDFKRLKGYTLWKIEKDIL